MIKFKFLFLTIAFFSCDNINDNYTWNENGSDFFYRKFGTNGYDYGWSGSFSPYDDSIIIAGSRQTIIGGDRDLWAIKTDSRGKTIWDKPFGGQGNDEGYDVVSTGDGGFIFVGYSWSFGNEQQIYVIKTDLNGVKIWEKNFGGAIWDVGLSIIELKNGNFAILGYTNSPGLSSGNTDFYLIMINNDGELLFERSYGNKEFPNHEWGYDIIELYDNSLIMVGARDRYLNGGKNILMLRINNNGDILWEKEIISEKNTDEIAYSISKDNAGGYFIISGENTDSNKEIYNPSILKIDSFGNIEWRRSYESNSREYHQFKSTTTNNGDLIIVGSSVVQSSLGENTNAFLTKFNKNGEIIWTRPYGTPDGDDWGWSVFEKPNQSLILIGSTKSYNASLFDVYLVGIN